MSGNNRKYFDGDPNYEPSRRSQNFQVHIKDWDDDAYENEPDYSSTALRTKNGDYYELRNPSKAKKSSGIASSRDRGCISAIIYAAAVCFISIFFSYWFIVGCNDMFALKKDEVSVVVSIPNDASLNDVAKILADNGIIEYPFFFKLYATVTKDTTGFKHGDFLLTTKTDYSEIIRKLTNPASSDGSTVKVTFPEGMNIRQYAELLEENNVCTAEAFLKRVNSTVYDFWFLKSIYRQAGLIDDDGNKTGAEMTSDKIYLLEGYLFPDTYEFYLNEGSQSAVKRMLTNFNVKITDDMRASISSSDYSLDQIIIIASIVERETPNPEEMPMVASVLYNRLKNRKTFPYLQSDATKAYPYAKLSDIPQNEAKNFVGKYDTYKIQGLPAGAICNPGIESIKAAINPAKSDYFYFYMDKNGKHYYSKTLEEHESVIRNCKANGLA
ncbi:MAG: endolytic transglycosylase MltG [Clostridia bacterium]|nr:endolytic transglycosylase MltG [Clostridia bacterium]